MFSYNKMLEFPINIKKKDSRLANIVSTQYGGAYQNVRVVLLTPPKYAF